MARGGEALVAALQAAGVEQVFGLPGVHNLAIWSALRDSPIRLVTVRHEQTAVYAADGYARATGHLGVAIVTTGPGAANTLAATGEAWASGSPVLVIATDIASTLRRPAAYRGALHETRDQAAMFAPVVKATHRAGTAEDFPGAVQAAIEAARAMPVGPVYLELGTDLLAMEVAASDLPLPSPPGLDTRGIEPAASLLSSAARPLVWAGGGALRAGAGEEVGRLADRLGAPVITTHSARGLLGRLHPLAVNLPPHLPEVGALWDRADVIVAVGSDLDGVMTQNWAQPRPRSLIALNATPLENYDPDVLIAGDARVGAAALCEALDRAPVQWADVAAVRRAALDRLRAEHPEEMAFLDAFAGAVPDDAVVVCDMCIPGYWLTGFHAVPAPRRLLTPFGWGTLGFGFPAAIGAALAGGGPAVAVCGDGGFLFACGELATVAQERPRLTVVVVDDGGYGMLRYDQRRAGEEPFGVDLHTPEFAALARSFGVYAEQVEGLGHGFGSALARHVALPEPSVLVARAALQPPPTTSPRWYRRA